MAEVRLVDLEIIKRFSLAVRSEYADAEEVLDALDASRKAVEQAAKPSRRGGAKRSTKRNAAKKSSAKRSSARRGSKGRK